jgi:hypothetical protein
VGRKRRSEYGERETPEIQIRREMTIDHAIDVCRDQARGNPFVFRLNPWHRESMRIYINIAYRVETTTLEAAGWRRVALTMRAPIGALSLPYMLPYL